MERVKFFVAVGGNLHDNVIGEVFYVALGVVYVNLDKVVPNYIFQERVVSIVELSVSGVVSRGTSPNEFGNVEFSR